MIDYPFNKALVTGKGKENWRAKDPKPTVPLFRVKIEIDICTIL